MLAQSFKSAADLKITEPQLSALQKTLVLLETGKLVHAPASDRLTSGHREVCDFTGHFNMARWRATEDCGTVCCIAGTAELIGGVEFPATDRSNRKLRDLFWATELGLNRKALSCVTTAQAATALRRNARNIPRN